MENLQEISNKLLALLPEEAKLTKGEDANEIEYKHIAGCKGAAVSIKIKKKFAIFTAVRNYDFQIKDKERIKFNEKVRSQNIQIYGQDQKLCVSKRILYTSFDELVDCYREFTNTLDEIIPEYEKNCVNFMIKLTRMGAVEFNPEDNVEIDKKNEHPEESKEKEEVTTKEFLKAQIGFCKNVLKKLAENYGTAIKETKTTSGFSKKLDENTLICAALPENDTTIKISFIADVPSAEAYLIIANLDSAYPEISKQYDEEKNSLIMSEYIMPDKFSPDEVKNTADKFVQAYSVAKKNISQNASDPDNLQLAAQMQEALKIQLDKIKERESALEEQEKIITAKLSNIQEREEILTKAKEEFEIEQDFKLAKLEEKRANIRKREAEIAQKEASMDEEQKKYMLSMQNMTSELSRLKNRIKEGGVNSSDEEIIKLQAQVKGLTSARAVMEKHYKEELANEHRKYQDLSEVLGKKEEELDILRQDLEAQARQLFEDERASYEKTIQKLQSLADISEDDLTLDSFVNFLEEKENYDGLKVLHGAEKDIVDVPLMECINAKIVFGNPMIIDVIKKIKKPDMRIINKLNRQERDTKFFVRDNAVVARKYFGKKISNHNVEKMMLDMTDYFKK